MKTTIIMVLVFFLAGINSLNAQHLEKVWETTGVKTPESVLYDEGNDVIFVSDINGDPSQKNGTGFISTLNSDGTIKKLEWVTGLDAPKGMAVYKGKLYVSDIDNLVEIDIKKGQIVKKYPAKDAKFLNDVTASSDGVIFVSDSQIAKIYALKNGKLSVWYEGSPFKGPNGLMAENGKLLVGDDNIYEIDIASKKVKKLVNDAGGVDGLEKDNDGNFVFSNWPGRIFIHKDGKTIKLLDTVDQKVNTADIDYDLKHHLILVPTFFDNRIVAYKIVD